MEPDAVVIRTSGTCDLTASDDIPSIVAWNPIPAPVPSVTCERAPLRRSCHAPAVDGTGLVVAAGILLLFAAVSRRVEGTSITAPIVFVGAGFLLGAEGLGWLNLESDQHTVSTLAEATLVIVLFTDASRIDIRALRREYSVPARLLGVGLPLTIVAGALAALVVLRDLTWSEALVLAVVLAPTDAALGQAVVTDESLPSRIRQGLNVESGLNDGMCVPLLTIALAIAETESGGASGAHAARLVAEAIGWGVAGGVVAAVVAAVVLRRARTRGWIEGHWVQVVPVVAAVGAFGLADARGGSGFIAAFVGGALFGQLSGSDADDAAFSEEIGGVLNGVTLIVFGAAVLGSLWSDISLAEVVYAVLSLTVVRMVPVAIGMIGSRARPATVLFLGWFGPRGLASIVFGVVVVEGAQLPHIGTLITTITVTVAISVVVHGVTAAPLARRYAAWSGTSASSMEQVLVPHQRWRHRQQPA
jgi:NhaP-type Na+/H+ or K+/H+ antiporter